MRSLERLEQQKRVKQQKQKTILPDEEIEEELEYPRFVPISRKKTAFDDAPGRTFGGINTAPSVFSKTAVFPDE